MKIVKKLFSSTKRVLKINGFLQKRMILSVKSQNSKVPSLKQIHYSDVVQHQQNVLSSHLHL